MKVVLKKLVGTIWTPVPIEELVGKSICSFIEESKDTVIAALYEGEEPVAFMSNDEEYVQLYKAKGLSMSVEDLRLLVGTDVMPSLIAKELEGSTFSEIIIDKEK
jgi:hypothetical protein